MKTKETKQAPEKKAAKEKPAKTEKQAENSVEKITEKPVEKLADKLEKSDEKSAEKPAESKLKEKILSEIEGDLEKKAEKEELTEKRPETANYQSTDEKSYQQGYSHSSILTYVKTQVIEPAATRAPAYTQPVQSKDAYVSRSADQKQPTPSHLETKLQAIETALQRPPISYARNTAQEKAYSAEKQQSQQQSAPSVIDSLLSLNTASEFSIPEVQVTTPQADLAGMQSFFQMAQTVYTAHKSGQKISGADLRMINDIKSEIGYKGSCCDELVVQRYAERKADARKAA
jgi:hypothetical protein